MRAALWAGPPSHPPCAACGPRGTVCHNPEARGVGRGSSAGALLHPPPTPTQENFEAPLCAGRGLPLSAGTSSAEPSLAGPEAL